MDKAPDAYRTISEVAEDLDLPQHVLRFWETRFGQIRPLKRGGGRRYYRPEDIDLLKGIRHLLYGEGYTIRGVQRIIKESGVKAIQALGRGEGAAALQKPKGPEIIDPLDRAPPLAHEGGEAAVLAVRQAPPQAQAPAAALPADDDEVFDEMDDEGPLDLPPVQTFGGPSAGSAAGGVAHRVEPQMPVSPRQSPPPAAATAPAPAPAYPMPSARPQAPVQMAPPAPPVRGLAIDDVRRLQAALYELLECRKRLDESFNAR